MDKRKTEDLSRRAFIGATIGTVVAATTGCGSQDGGLGLTGAGGDAEAGGGKPANQASGGSRSGSSSTGKGGAQAAGGATGTGTTEGVGGATQQGGATGQGGSSGRGGASASGGRSQAQGGSSASGSGGSAKDGGASAGGSSGGTGGSSGGGSKAGAGGANRGGSSGVSGGTPVAGDGGGGGTGGPALVSLVRGTDWVQATMDAIALAGGLPDLSGKNVLIKPNIISADANATTSKDVIHGVIRAAKAKNAAKITVTDSGWGSGKLVLPSMDKLGISDVCKAEGAETMDLEAGPHSKRTHANASAFPNGINFSDDLCNAGYVINVPVCKSHTLAKFTMALKNWYGGWAQLDRDHENIGNLIAEFHLLKQEDFVVLDATKAMVTGGPDKGTMKQSQIVVASKDAIAADVAGLCVHKHYGAPLLTAKGDVWKLDQIKRALALKFPGWLSSPQAFSYVQQGVTEHAEIMAWREV